MPQMAPTMWTFLLFFMLTLNLIISSFLFHYKMKNLKKNIKNKNF